MGITIAARRDIGLLGDQRLVREIIRMICHEVEEVEDGIRKSNIEGIGYALAGVVLTAYGWL
jgi:hypothetical protein